MNDAVFDELERRLVVALDKADQETNLTNEDIEYVAKVAKACDCSYLMDSVSIRIGHAKNKHHFKIDDKTIVIDRKAINSLGQDDRRAVLRRSVCTVIDRELHGAKAGGWELGFLIREAERRC